MEKCIFCLDNDINTTFIGCGHMSYCYDCVKSKNIMMCPNCRKNSQCIKIYQCGFELNEKDYLDNLKLSITETENNTLLSMKEKEEELKRLENAKNILAKTLEEKTLLNQEAKKTYDEINKLKELTLMENIKIKQEAEKIKKDLENSKISLENSIRKIYNEADQSTQNEKNLNKTIEQLCKSGKKFRKINHDEDVVIGSNIKYLVKKKNGNLQLSKLLNVTSNNQNEITVKKKDKLININKDQAIFLHL